MRQLEPRIVRNHGGSSSVGLAAEQCTVIKTCVILWHYYRYTEFILANNDVNLILHPFEETLPPGLRGNEGNIVGKKKNNLIAVKNCLHFASCMACC